MINRLLEELKKLIPKGLSPFDASAFDDSVALKTEWSPLKGGGTNICTHKLRATSGSRREFRPSAAYIAFCGLFAAIGLAVIMVFAFAAHPPRLVDYAPSLIGVVFFTVGLCLFIFGGKPVVFDKEVRLAWRAWRDPRTDFEHGEEQIQSLCKLEDIHALQIVSEICHSKKRSYLSYELNLVFPNGSRLNVVDHGDIKRLRQDAAELGVFLEVPVWDATVKENGR